MENHCFWEVYHLCKWGHGFHSIVTNCQRVFQLSIIYPFLLVMFHASRNPPTQWIVPFVSFCWEWLFTQNYVGDHDFPPFTEKIRQNPLIHPNSRKKTYFTVAGTGLCQTTTHDAQGRSEAKPHWRSTSPVQVGSDMVIGQKVKTWVP